MGSAMTKRRLASLLIAIVIVLSVSAGVWSATAQGGQRSTLSPLPAAATYQPNAIEQQTAALYQKATTSVVYISVVTRTGAGTGSGFVIDTDGHIVTNNHVIENAVYIQATFVDGESVEAELVGRDPDADLAVIRVDPSAVRLQPIAFADSDKVFVGQQVFAIGSPFGQDFTLTSGIVSGLDRSLQNANRFSIPQLIQTDAAINPGNSGGPLLDWDGNVIGVNTAILSESNSNSGVGFAIPANTVRRIVPYLIERGSFEHSWLGIAGSTLLPAQREAMDLSADVKGVLVSEVTARGPAARAGLSGATATVMTPFGRLAINGDIITAVNGEPISQMNQLITYLETHTLPGDVITLTVLRNGRTVEIPVTLQARP